MADPAWSIEIGDIVIDQKMNFDLDFRVVEQDNGQVDHLEGYIEVEADLTSDDPDPDTAAEEIAADLVERLNMVMQAGSPVAVVIKLNGTAVEGLTFEPQVNVGSPRVVRFRTIDDDGAGDSHWRHHITIYVKTPKGSQNLMEIQSSIFDEKQVDKETKKVWSISAKSFDLATAFGVVKGFKPSDPYVVEQIERFPKENRVVARWVWEARETQKRIQTVENPPEILGGGNAFIVEKVARGRNENTKPFPVVHEARQDEVIIIIRGVRTGFDAASVAAPPAHYTESKDTIRQTKDETDYKPTFDSKTGIFTRPFEERWLFLKHLDAIPEPDHSDHKDRVLIDPPADGGLGT